MVTPLSTGSHWTPNLNQKQNGVLGLQQALAKTDGKNPLYTGSINANGAETIVQTYPDGTKRVTGDTETFMFMSADGKRPAHPYIQHNKNTNVTTYTYGAITPQGDRVAVKAYDSDSDGNIDRYEYRDSTGRHVFTNPNDNGKDNFREEEQPTTKYAWYDPRGWFK